MNDQGKVNRVVVADGVILPEGADVVVMPPGDRVAEPDETSIWSRLSDLSRWAEDLPTDLPTDLAAQHDHYLHGSPKRP